MKNLGFYFFADLLNALENGESINYSYSINLIREINNKNESIQGNILTKLLLSKICLDLIDNLSSMNSYSEENDEELDEIKEKNKNIISENINYFEKIGLKYKNEEEDENEDNNEEEEENQNFVDNQIDKIYSDIINSLIKNNKIKDYDFTVNIMKEMDIENINITQDIYDELSETLNNEEIVKEYKIEKKDDFFNESKINFYYILIKYIFKNPLYIYHINFFLETRKLILNLFRTNKEIIDTNNLDEPLKERANFVIRKLVDIDYYFDNGNSESKKKLEIILEYYKEILFDSKKKEIELFENIIKTNKKIDDDLLKDYETAKKIPIIKYLYDNDKMKKKKKKSEKIMKEFVESWNNLEKFIREGKIEKIKADKRRLIYNYIIKDENNKNIFLQIFDENIFANFINTHESLEPKNVKNENKQEKNYEKNGVKKSENLNQDIEKENKEKKEGKDKDIDNIKEEKKEDSKYESIDESKEIENSQISYETKGAESKNEISKDSFELKKENQNNISNNENIKYCEKPKKEKEEDIPKKINSFSYNNKNFLEIDDSKVYNFSFNFSNPAPPKIPEEFDNIPDFISSKFSAFLYSNKKEIYPFINYNEIYFGENLDIQYNRYKQFLDYKENNNLINENKEINKNLKKFFEFLKEIDQRLKNEFENEYMLIIKLELVKEKENINNNINNNIYNITAYYTFFDPLNNMSLKYKDENILINKTNSNLQGFEFLLHDINCDKYKNIEYSEKQYDDKNYKKSNQKLFDNNKIIYNNNVFAKRASEFSVIEFIKIIDKTKYSADFIKLLSNGYYIVGSQNILYIYDKHLLLKHYFTKDCYDWVYSVCESVLYKKKLQNKNNIIQILCFMNNFIGLLEYDLTNKTNNLSAIETKPQSKKKSKNDKNQTNISYSIGFEMREYNYVFAGINGAAYYLNFLGNKTKIEQMNISDQAFKSGIKLNENIVALASNRVLPGGKDKLIFYNVKSKKKNKSEIENYSFNMNEHGMSLITWGKKESNEKILVCACKKYLQGQKNGILLINPNLGENEEIKNPFYDTEDYEVCCFCPIFTKEKNNLLFDDDENELNFDEDIYIEETVFFLVAGYDVNKQMGLIKLYKVIPGEKTIDTKIKFLQNIEFDEENKNFEGFDVHIKCMIQSKTTGNIIVTCSDGNIYLFTKPNLEFYIEN